jgi:hypothetical protein
LSRSNIPQNITAVARMNALGKLLGVDRAALRTGPRCATPIDQAHDRAGALCLIPNVPDRAIPFRHRLGEHTAGPSADVQIFDDNVGETVHQGSGETVRKIPAPVGNTGVQPGNTEFCLALSVAAAFFAGNGPLSAPKRLGGPSSQPRYVTAAQITHKRTPRAEASVRLTAKHPCHHASAHRRAVAQGQRRSFPPVPLAGMGTGRGG